MPSRKLACTAIVVAANKIVSDFLNGNVKDFVDEIFSIVCGAVCSCFLDNFRGVREITSACAWLF